jgi:hypothetical protein
LYYYIIDAGQKKGVGLCICKLYAYWRVVCVVAPIFLSLGFLFIKTRWMIQPTATLLRKNNDVNYQGLATMFLRHFPPGVVIIKRTSIIFHSTYPICLCKALFVSFFGFFCFLNTSTGACLIKPFVYSDN